MLPMITQPAVAPACYVPRERDTAALLFNAAASTYLTRTPSVAGNRRRSTQSMWVQRGKLPSDLMRLWYVQITTGRNFSVYFDGNNKLVQQTDRDGIGYGATSAAVYRDIAPMHVMSVVDTDQDVPEDRARLYVNGCRITLSGSWCAKGTDHDFNSTAVHSIGRHVQNIQFFDGLMADFVNVDGLTLDPSVFGEFNIHGVWVPKPAAEIHAAVVAAGGWGTNGCHLDFADPLQPGKDVSGQGNHWTASGFDVDGKDTVASTPTNVYAALNPLDKSPYVAVGGGGLEFTGSASGTPGIAATLAFDIEREAKEWEMTVGTLVNHWIGIIKDGTPGDQSYSSTSAISYQEDGRKHVLGVASAFAETYAGTDKIRCRCGGGQIQFLKNGKVVGTAASGLTGRWRPYFYIGRAYTAQVDFGQRGMVPGAGYTTLCTDNLPEPIVKDPAEAVVQASATGANIVPVLANATAHWNGAAYVEIIKRREAVEDWRVRFSDDPDNAWATNNASAKAAAPSLAAAEKYAGCWLRVGAKFGVWTAEVVHTSGTATTVTHNLATARNAVIATRVSGTGGDRLMWHPDLTAGTLLKLNGAAVAAAANGTLTNFGASSFQIASSAPSGTYRVLVLAERPGLLTLATLTGNGAADGGFASADISPVLALMVPASAANSRLWDAARNPANQANISSALNLPDAESTAYGVDMVVGGIKARTTDAAVNGSGVKYHLVLWGRPVGGVCVAPATAR